MNRANIPHVPVSWGELLDKLTILDIKRARIARPEARANVETERRLLHGIGAQVLSRSPIRPLFESLRRINEELWEIEDAIRVQEANGAFGPSFIALARSVYRKNDLRAAIKRDINRLLDSPLVEEKSYAEIGPALPPARQSRSRDEGHRT